MLDKKRNNEFEAIRRLHLNNAMKKIQMPAAMQQMACNTNQPMQPAMSNHGGCCGGGSAHAHAHTNCCSPPTPPQKSGGHPLGFESFSLKEEPVAEVTEIDSGCESPQEQPSPLVNILIIYIYPNFAPPYPHLTLTLPLPCHYPYRTLALPPT